MWMSAQAVAEYGGLTASRTANSSMDNVLSRVMDASATDYVLVIAGVLVAMFLISKLLDAA
jgi:hypothetical protein